MLSTSVQESKDRPSPMAQQKAPIARKGAVFLIINFLNLLKAYTNTAKGDAFYETTLKQIGQPTDKDALLLSQARLQKTLTIEEKENLKALGMLDVSTIKPKDFIPRFLCMNEMQNFIVNVKEKYRPAFNALLESIVSLCEMGFASCEQHEQQTEYDVMLTLFNTLKIFKSSLETLDNLIESGNPLHTQRKTVIKTLETGCSQFQSQITMAMHSETTRKLKQALLIEKQSKQNEVEKLNKQLTELQLQLSEEKDLASAQRSTLLQFTEDEAHLLQTLKKQTEEKIILQKQLNELKELNESLKNNLAQLKTNETALSQTIYDQANLVRESDEIKSVTERRLTDAKNQHDVLLQESAKKIEAIKKESDEKIKEIQTTFQQKLTSSEQSLLEAKIQIAQMQKVSQNNQTEKITPSRHTFFAKTRIGFFGVATLISGAGLYGSTCSASASIFLAVCAAVPVWGWFTLLAFSAGLLAYSAYRYGVVS